MVFSWVERLDKIMADGKWRSMRRMMKDAQSLVIGGEIEAADTAAWIDSHNHDCGVVCKDVNGYVYFRLLPPFIPGPELSNINPDPPPKRRGRPPKARVRTGKTRSEKRRMAAPN
jgi:hypothetical protein